MIRLMICGVFAGLAMTTGWTPAAVEPGPWEVLSEQEPMPPGVIALRNKCPQDLSIWQRPDPLWVATKVYTCASPTEAQKLAGIMRSNASPVDRQPVFGVGIDFQTVQRPKNQWIVDRFWAQGNLVLVAEAQCGPHDQATCQRFTDAVARSFAESLPGAPSPWQSTSLNVLTGILALGGFVWLMSVGLPGLIRYLRRDRYPLPAQHSAWTDVSRVSWRLRWQSFAWGTLVGLRRTAVVLAVVLAGTLLVVRTPASAVGLVVTLGAIAGLTVLVRRVWRPAFGTRRRWREVRDGAGSRWYLLGGLAILGITRSALLFVLGSVLVAAYFEASGGFASALAIKLAETSWGTTGFWNYYLLTIIGMGAEQAAGLVGLIAVAVIALLLAVDQFGRRLLMPTVRRAAGTPTPDVLYLRNFGDDKLRLRASRISRRGLLGRLSPWRTRPFESLVIRRLSAAGSVLAVNEPGLVLASHGVEKVRLPAAGWEPVVAEMASQAKFVVVSATPTTINPGFAAELNFLATTLGHQRIMLVLGSWRRDRLAANWQRFLAATAGLELFSGVESACPSLATHVLVHIPGLGWQGWGAEARSEWTYVVAIDQALQYALPRWEGLREPATTDDV
ncbi:hypothetical protein [Kibdelosporangium aridum]|uniref:DUF2868 domain-containing protein n=1 Tax=Kibdelosporangium aridum TaxID=2030 RepID=A0A1Y5X205_KIBAR|nr:hypothetical protein [Kibdelosporangium aridum]SMC65726.1 hypothetical protein SAMN05661093_01201 [Kibdelosporangium aridum]